MSNTRLPERSIDPLRGECPVWTALDVIQGRWKPSILCALQDGAMRFSELQALLPALSPQVLTQQLRELEADEIVTRTVYPEGPTRVEYSLSEFGRTPTDILERFEAWGETYRERRRRPN